LLSQRIASAVVLLVLLIPAGYAGGWWYFAFLVAFGTIALWELRGLIAHAGIRAWEPILFGVPFLLALGAMLPQWDLARPTVAAAVIGASAWQLSRRPESRSLADWAMTIAAAMYVGWLGAQVVFVRVVPDGLAWTIFLYAVILLTDTAAYFGGRAFGRHQFTPTISPKKTWEGAIIGWAFGGLFAIGLARFLQLPMSPAAALALGLATSLVSTIGDLTFSFFKRQAHVKDSSQLIPGHGGFLDRLDSVLTGAAVVATYIVWFVR